LYSNPSFSRKVRSRAVALLGAATAHDPAPETLGNLVKNRLQEIADVCCWTAPALAAPRVFEFARALPPTLKPGIRAEVRASAPPLFS